MAYDEVVKKGPGVAPGPISIGVAWVAIAPTTLVSVSWAAGFKA